MYKMKTWDIRLAEVKYYHDGYGPDHKKGIELENDSRSVVIIKRGEYYANFFNPEETYPLLKRVPYSNDYYGEDFGTMLVPVTPIRESGNCFVEYQDLEFSSILEELDEVKLEEYVLNSRRPFLEKKDIAMRRLQGWSEPTRMLRILKTMMSPSEIFLEFFSAKEKTNSQQKLKVK